jgi:hypothetical protein
MSSLVYIADKLASGLVSYLVRMGSDAVMSKPKQWWEEKERRDELQDAIQVTLDGLEKQFPDLVHSLFDKTFLETRGSAEIAKALSLAFDQVPDPNSLALAFSGYFARPVPNLLDACTYFLALFRKELESRAEFAEVITHKLVRRTAQDVGDVQLIVRAILERLEQERSIAPLPVFEASAEGVVDHKGICSADQIVIRNVGAPISQVRVQQLLLLNNRFYDFNSATKSALIRTYGYYDGSAPTGRAQGVIYRTTSTQRRLKMHRLIEIARQTPIYGHLALLDFERFLKITYRDSVDKVRTFCMKIDELGYKEISTDEFERLSAAAAFGPALDIGSIKDEEFLLLLRDRLSAN